MDILFIDNANIFRSAIITLKAEDGAFLDNFAFFRNMGVGIGQLRGKKALPFLIRKMVLVQLFDTLPQIGN